MSTGAETGEPGAETGEPGAATTVRRGLGPFVTLIETHRPDGLVARWDSRRRRKHWNGRAATAATWWAPRARGWWIAVLFAVGSALFALGAVPALAAAIGTRADALTFFAGSLFFTSAGFLQYRESVDTGSTGGDRRRVLVFRPRQIDWLASAVQLAGTVYFNVSTANAVRIDLTVAQAQQHVWRPDAIGSVCFLVASGLAWCEVCHGWLAWSPGRLAWWITLLNLVGSVAFGISAVAASIVPATGDLRNARLSNLGTFVGAVCFLAGAVLLLPERTEGGDASDP